METRTIDGIEYEIKMLQMGAEVFLNGEPIGSYCKTSPKTSTPHQNGYNFYGYYVWGGSKQPLTVGDFSNYPPEYVNTFDDAILYIVERHARSQAASLLGKKGGSVTSERKSASSRENGKKGGRPRKTE